jgi:catechol 2,3-dioxygenase
MAKKNNSKLQPIEKNLNPIDPGVDIGHVHLKSGNLDKIYDFYVGILGFDVVTRLPSALFLSAGSYHHHLAFNTWESEGGSAPPKHMTGLYHVAIRYPKRSSLGDALRRLVKAEWPIDGVNDHGTHEALYLRDPDDNGLELYWDRPESQWPKDKDGHLVLGGQQLNLQSLLKEV